ncbi:hypothetical protein KIPE111705_43655 [Kibdelosporangium persicum]|uniref:hypothetical protein n=1 Tax=Kibdelosporangium persicum TaxID=2698649 RepID=UPI001562FCB4|nr:hypothetical protein [Kibdelosporangium persicum]
MARPPDALAALAGTTAPGVPYTAYGHGRILAVALKSKQRTQLRACVEKEPRAWGFFVRDADLLPWTFYSPDLDYAAMFAPIAHQLHLTMEVFAEKFPAWGKDWSVPVEW